MRTRAGVEWAIQASSLLSKRENSRCDIVVMVIWIGQSMHIMSDPRHVGVLIAARHSIDGSPCVS